ncbi:hypothetical protein [Streptomyces sp. NPDC087270]|uniref:hypothetical protein n=1 Tax=Streptomyces sp. NPDC087270 TaxID=3365774 RepID=UPI0037FD1723
MPSRHPRGFTCGRRSVVPPGLVTAALGVANAAPPAWDGLVYAAEDAATLLVCTFPSHRGQVHHSVVLNLRGPDAGTVWRDGVEPCLAFLLPDCPVTTEDGDEGCSEFAGHPGAHSWDLADPRTRPALSALLALFGPLLTEQDQPPDGRVVDAATRFHRPTTNRNPGR